MFTNWSTDSYWGKQREESIPASRFEVERDWSGYVPNDILISVVVALVAGTVFLAIGTLLAVTSAYGSTSFWLGAGQMGLGVTTITAALICLRYCTRDFHQTRMLHHAQNLEEYQELLESDQGVHYTVRAPGYLKRHEDINHAMGTSLERATGADALRLSLYLVNGKPIDVAAVAQEFGENRKYANQSAISDLLAFLMSRYQSQNTNSNIHVRQRDISKNIEPNTRYNLVRNQSGEPLYLQIDQLYEIIDMDRELRLKYIQGSMHIDLVSRDAVISWSSPQNERPSF